MGSAALGVHLPRHRNVARVPGAHDVLARGDLDLQRGPGADRYAVEGPPDFGVLRSGRGAQHGLPLAQDDVDAGASGLAV